MSLNEWLEITTQQNISNMAETFSLPITKFLYPRPGDSFQIRIIGSLHPYYRSYINPNHLWASYTNYYQFKQCLNGNVDSILSLAKNLIEKSQYLSKKYEIDIPKKSITCKSWKLSIWSTTSVPPVNNRHVNGNNAEELSDEERINFLQSCLNKNKMGIWSPCIVANAYIRNGNRLKGSIQPTVITKSMFSNLIREYTNNQDLLKNVSISSISGINAYDLLLYRDLNSGYKAPLLLKILQLPNVLTYDEISNIMRQKLINIDVFSKKTNKQSLESFSGFIYKPFKSIKDAAETLNILQDVENLEKEDQYDAAEKELCNIPLDLSTEVCFENGPISSIELI